jgi:hypothetical protein
MENCERDHPHLIVLQRVVPMDVGPDRVAWVRWCTRCNHPVRSNESER